MSLLRPSTDPYLLLAHERLVAWLGIDPSRGGIARAIERHVAERVEALGRPSPAVFAERLAGPTSDEGRALVAVATVPHSWLFRDPVQLEGLIQRLATTTNRRRTANVWIAGCAGGEEPYTLAALARFAGLPIRILATDVNESALLRARCGEYDAWAARDVPARARTLLSEHDGRVVIGDALREVVRFSFHSLVSAPPLPPSIVTLRSDEAVDAESDRDRSLPGGWDAIVCRNVLIYFAAEVAVGLVTRMASALAPDGALVLGTSDVLAELPPGLVVAPDMGRMVLAKPSGAGASHSAGTRAPASATRLAVPVPTLAASRESSVVPILPSVSSAPASVTSTPTSTFAVAEAPDAFADLGAGNDARALAAALDRLGADPLDAEASLLAGLALHACGAYTQAAERLRAAACLAPGAWAAWFYLALSWERLGCWEDARRAFRQVASARGEGEDFPRGASELAVTLRGSRARLVDIANHRERVLGPSSIEQRRGS